MTKNSEKNNDSHLLWHKRIGKETRLEVESPDPWFEDAGGCQREGMILRVAVGKYKICDLTYSQVPRIKGTVINLKNK